MNQLNRDRTHRRPGCDQLRRWRRAECKLVLHAEAVSQDGVERYRSAIQKILRSRHLQVASSLGSELVKSLTSEEIRGLGLDDFIHFDRYAAEGLSEEDKNIARDGMIRQALFRAGCAVSSPNVVADYLFGAVVHHRDYSAGILTDDDANRYSRLFINLAAGSAISWGAGAFAVNTLGLSVVGRLISGFLSMLTILAIISMAPKTLKTLSLVGKSTFHGRFRLVRRISFVPLLITAAVFTAEYPFWVLLPFVPLELLTILAKAALFGVIAVLTRFYIERILRQDSPAVTMSPFFLLNTSFLVSRHCDCQSRPLPFAATLAHYLDSHAAEPDDEPYREAYRAMTEFLQSSGERENEEMMDVYSSALPGFAQNGEANQLCYGLVRAVREKLDADEADRFLRAIMDDPRSFRAQAARLRDKVRPRAKAARDSTETTNGRQEGPLRAIAHLWGEFADDMVVERMERVLHSGGVAAEEESFSRFARDVEAALDAFRGPSYADMQMRTWHEFDAFLSRELFPQMMAEHVAVRNVALKVAVLLAFTQDSDGKLRALSPCLREGEARKQALGAIRNYLGGRPFDIPASWERTAAHCFAAIQDWPMAQKSPEVVKWLVAIPPEFFRDRRKLGIILKVISDYFSGGDASALKYVMDLIYLRCLEPQTALQVKRDWPLPYAVNMDDNHNDEGALIVSGSPSMVVFRFQQDHQAGPRIRVTESSFTGREIVNWLLGVADSPDIG